MCAGRCAHHQRGALQPSALRCVAPLLCCTRCCTAMVHAPRWLLHRGGPCTALAATPQWSLHCAGCSTAVVNAQRLLLHCAGLCAALVAALHCACSHTALVSAPRRLLRCSESALLAALIVPREPRHELHNMCFSRTCVYGPCALSPDASSLRCELPFCFVNHSPWALPCPLARAPQASAATPQQKPLCLPCPFAQAPLASALHPPNRHRCVTLFRHNV